MRDNFLIYRSHIEALRGLPPEQFKNAVLAIADYAMDGIEPHEDPVAVAMWMMTKPIIDKNAKRYESAKRGGRPTGKTDDNKNQTETKSKPNVNQTITELKPNDNQTETKPEPNRNLNDKCKMINVKDNISSTSDEVDSTRRRVMDEWNALESLGITPIKAIVANSKRHEMLKARVKQYGEDAVIAAIRSIKDSRFLCGHSQKGWVITFDWFIKPNNFAKVYDGNYKDTQTKTSEKAGVKFTPRSYDYDALEKELLRMQANV